jgi:hypothetical protein
MFKIHLITFFKTIAIVALLIVSVILADLFPVPFLFTLLFAIVYTLVYSWQIHQG